MENKHLNGDIHTRSQPNNFQTGKSYKRRHTFNHLNSLKHLEEDGVQETKENSKGKQSMQISEIDTPMFNVTEIDVLRKSRSNSNVIERRKDRKRCQSAAHILQVGVRRRSSVDTALNRFRKLEKSLSVVTTRRRELALAKVSLYIVFVMLLCHSVRLIPNTYEMIQTYTQVKYKYCSLSIYY